MFISEFLALGAATCIAMSGMLINELNGRVGLFRLARWQLLAAFGMTASAALVTGGWRSLEGWHVGALAASSLFGIMIASTTYFAAIYAAGPRVTALLFSLTSPFALILGYLVLGETIDLQQALGVVLVLAGILLAIGLPGAASATEATSRQRISRTGIALGLVTALGQALGSLCARPAMADGVEPFTAMAVRSGFAALFFVVLAFVPLRPLRSSEAFSWKALGLGVTASFFGTGLGMSLLMAALAGGNVGIVSTLSSMTPVVILPMLWIRTGVAPRPSAWLGAGLAVVGTGLISL
ncbi:DMT family transporter [Rhizobium sp. G187]|uniref:DMT family transporter n=1 Tax=Rhizobium sp. G187 TaxID=3451352 RepID=UPI003EE48AB9